MNFFIHFIDDPRRRFGDSPFRPASVLLFIIDVELDLECFSFWRIIIDLLLNEAVNTGVINPDDKSILGLGLIVNPYFCDRMHAVQGNNKRKKLASTIALLFGSNHMLSNSELTKLSVHVKQYWTANELALSQQAELGTSKVR